MKHNEKINLDVILNAIDNEWQRYRLLKDTYEQFVSFHYNEIKVAIVGNSPYPQSPIGIAFCRSSWDNLNKENCSGNNLLRALVGMDVEQLSQKFHSLISFFFWLATKGIIFLNRYQEDDFTRKVVADNSGKIILCGKKSHSLGPNEKFKVPHPSNQAKAQDKQSWSEIWEKFDTFCNNLGKSDPYFTSDIKSVLDKVIQEIKGISI